ncbi:MAG: alpha-mannosidase [Bacteroidetes bacterium]|nr:alpha-mannosidase [Bacteroidota bacterium]
MEKTYSEHLICNAHIDPAWLWEWEEGTAAALSTFRAAADFCEEYDEFVFNHNEALLYEYIEELDPPLFERIRVLVKSGKWIIMGGWFLQPDCNLPSGESILRQIEVGRDYFKRTFGIDVKQTAINFDPFGHSRGLVQLLRRSGYTSYLICRPNVGTPGSELPGDMFTWEGLDGSQITVLRTPYMYNSVLGKVTDRIQMFLEQERERSGPGLLLWGVGNHGGGASRKDITDIGNLPQNLHLKHSTVDNYFSELDAYRQQNGVELPVFSQGLNPWGVGCYTSQIRIKQKHRELENLLFSVEKMAAQAAVNGLTAYPEAELLEAQRDLLIMEFHDILPGSGIPAVEEYGLRLAGHGLEVLSRLRFKILCALLLQEPPVPAGSYPIYVYNPHPHMVSDIFSCEMQLEDQNYTDVWTTIRLTKDGETLPSQIEKEESNIPLDWRKKVTFRASLEPGLNRFVGYPEVLQQTLSTYVETMDRLSFTTESMKVEISRITGLLDSFAVLGDELIGSEGIVPVVLADTEDPWGMENSVNLAERGRFRLMTHQEAADFRGFPITETPAAVTVIETGAVRTVVEVLMTYGNSNMVILYSIPAKGSRIEISIRVKWDEIRSKLKLRIPTALQDRHCISQIMAGREELPPKNMECAGQKWAVVHDQKAALAIINDGTYGLDFDDSVLRLTLLRSPAYSAHPLGDREIVRKDRYTPRIDHGERIFNFRIQGGGCDEVLTHIDREAQEWAESPYALSVFPLGKEAAAVHPALELVGDGVILTSLRMDGNGPDVLRFHLQETTGNPISAQIRFLGSGDCQTIMLEPFEVAEYHYNVLNGELKYAW